MFVVGYCSSTSFGWHRSMMVALLLIENWHSSMKCGHGNKKLILKSIFTQIVNVHQNGYYYLLLTGQEQNNTMMLQINWFLLKLLKNSINGLQQNIKMHSFYVDIRYHILLLIKHCYQKLARNDK
jgi:hypothetical protein